MSRLRFVRSGRGHRAAQERIDARTTRRCGVRPQVKLPNSDPRLGHDHVANAHAVLQSVNIRTNAWGLRGGSVSDAPARERAASLMLGSSIALGWGVDEDKEVSSFLEKKLKADRQRVEVLNGGVGNDNAERYVAKRFLSGLLHLQPTDLLVLAFVRDGEELTRDSGNVLLAQQPVGAHGLGRGDPHDGEGERWPRPALQTALRAGLAIAGHDAGGVRQARDMPGA